MDVIDVEGLRKMSGYDDSFVSEILKLFAERSAKDLDEVSAARKAGATNTVKFVVHRMRSAAVPLGLKELVVLLKKVELAIDDDETANLDKELDTIEKITREAIEHALLHLKVVS